MAALGEVENTQRGFQIINFKDFYGVECSLQQSSLYQGGEAGADALWLGNGDTRMHLSVDKCEALVEVLSHWLDTGRF